MTTLGFRSALLIAAVALVPLLVSCGDESAARTAEPEAVVMQADEAHSAAHAGHEDETGHDVHVSHAARAEHEHSHHGAHAPLAATELPGTSLFHLNSAWTNEEGEAFKLPDLRGRPAVVVMFYGDCTTACPLLVKTAEDIEAALPSELSGGVSFVMVTFATEADTPAKLKDYAQEKGLDRSGWHWLVGSELQTRQLATLLGVQYRDLGNGMFAHSNVVTVLDADGVPAARLEGLGVDTQPAVQALLDAR